VSNGCTPLVDCISFILADEGEGLLIPAPYYGSFWLDLQTRARVVPFEVQLSSKIGPGESQPFELSERRLEGALKKAQEQAFFTCHRGRNLHALWFQRRLLRDKCTELKRHPK